MAPLLIFILAFELVISAHDYGTFGNTFPIEEQNLLEYLRERLLSTSNEEMEDFAKKQIQLIRSPKSIDLPNAIRHLSFFYDPTITVNEDIKDHEGNIIIKKGTVYNPLDHTPLNDNLLFFDATQESHLAWAKTEKGLWILADGSPLAIEEQENRAVYFDQFGYITNKLGVKSIPAKVSQEGKRLKIEEIFLEAA